MSANLANAGYGAVKKETTPGVAVVPDTFFQYYNESMMSNQNFDMDNPIMGVNHELYATRPGLRNHQGAISALAEPNTAAMFMNMLFAVSGTTGSNPYTHTYSAATDPNSYTLDLSKGTQAVYRFFGVQARQIAIAFEENKMVFNIDLSALGSFTFREVASVSGSGPYTATLKTAYDSAPTKGLVVGDLIKFWDVSGGTYINAIVDAVTDTTIEVSEDISSIADGDLVTLRPQTPSYSVQDPFMWARTEFRFAADAATALSASQTRLEQGSGWTLRNGIENDSGTHPSGGYDPARFNRLQTGADITAKVLFENGEDYNRFLSNAGRALVVRHYSETGYELRVTFNEIKRIDPSQQPVESGSIVYDDITYAAQYNETDTQAIGVVVINSLSSI